MRLCYSAAKRFTSVKHKKIKTILFDTVSQLVDPPFDRSQLERNNKNALLNINKILRLTKKQRPLSALALFTSQMVFKRCARPKRVGAHVLYDLLIAQFSFRLDPHSQNQRTSEIQNIPAERFQKAGEIT